MKPNIVFFFTDDQRFDTIAALGNKEIRTPNMDRLVKEGTTFTQGHIPGGTCGAVCMPSRAMLHTGRTLFHLEGEGQNIPDEHITLGETLQKAGYRTFGTGKWHNGTASYARSFTDGGEIFFGGMWDHWNVPACNYDPTGEYGEARNWIQNPMYNSKKDQVCADHITLGKHSSELFSEASINFIEKYDDDDPFFMYISYMAPHDPRTMPDKFLTLYDKEKITLPENYAPEHSFEYGTRSIRDEVLAPYPRTPEIVKEHLAEYYAMITHLDHEIGRVMDSLKEKGIYESTIFVFAGDNGLALGQHGLFGKQSCYEHSVRVPLLFAGPGIPEGKSRDAFAYLLDIYPTLCDLTGIDIPESVEGKSLLPLMNDKTRTVRDSIYLAYEAKIRAVKNNRYKLIEYVDDREPKNIKRNTQLFDLQMDSGETNNLADRPDFTEIKNELHRELFRLREEWEDKTNRFCKRFWRGYNESK